MRVGGGEKREMGRNLQMKLKHSSNLLFISFSEHYLILLQVTVMIMSLKAGNLGLNMVAACHVILLDPWWNPTTEDQAIDRAHRIGQLRPVTVSRLTVCDTVEDRILALQVTSLIPIIYYIHVNICQKEVIYLITS